MSAFEPTLVLAQYIELREQRARAFLALLDLKRRAAEGDYEFFPTVDIDLAPRWSRRPTATALLIPAQWDAAALQLNYTIDPLTQTQREFSHVFEQAEE